ADAALVVIECLFEADLPGFHGAHDVLKLGHGGLEGLGGCGGFGHGCAGGEKSLKITDGTTGGQTPFCLKLPVLFRRISLVLALGGSGMSDIASRTLLAPGVSQLPVSTYFDEQVFQQELKLLF